jgi:hypothetical protein
MTGSIFAVNDHPAADSDLPPPVLLRYYDLVCTPLFEHNEYFNSAVGRAVRTWNSKIGIPFPVFHAVMYGSSRLCNECRCMYSLDGFHAHINNGRCMNKPGTPIGTLPHSTS